MAAEEGAAPVAPPNPVYATNVPALYADGVTSVLPGEQVIKFHLYRADPPLNVAGDPLMIGVAQVVMSLKSFAQTAIFFESVLKSLVEDGLISQSEIDQIWKAFK